MRRPRKTKAQREQEWDEAKRHVWEQFRPRLAALADFGDALKLAHEGPRHDRPGRMYYMNLAFVLQAFRVPGEASDEELALYSAFFQRIDKAGQLKPGEGQKVEEALRSVLDRRRRQ